MFQLPSVFLTDYFLPWFLLVHMADRVNIEIRGGGSIHHSKTKHFQTYIFYADNKQVCQLSTNLNFFDHETIKQNKLKLPFYSSRITSYPPPVSYLPPDGGHNGCGIWQRLPSPFSSFSGALLDSTNAEYPSMRISGELVTYIRNLIHS